jgi:hypothetical protein
LCPLLSSSRREPDGGLVYGAMERCNQSHRVKVIKVWDRIRKDLDDGTLFSVLLVRRSLCSLPEQWQSLGAPRRWYSV